MRPSQLDQDHHRGQKWDLLGEIEELKRRMEVLERASALGLFEVGGTTMLAPGSVLACSTSKPPDGRALFRGYGGYGGYMVWEGIGIGATAYTVIGGSENVNRLLYFRSITSEVSGPGSNLAMAQLAPGGNMNLYSDGVDVCNLAVSAGGAVTIVRTAGTDTFNVIAVLLWH